MPFAQLFFESSDRPDGMVVTRRLALAGLGDSVEELRHRSAYAWTDRQFDIGVPLDGQCRGRQYRLAANGEWGAHSAMNGLGRWTKHRAQGVNRERLGRGYFARQRHGRLELYDFARRQGFAISTARGSHYRVPLS